MNILVLGGTYFIGRVLVELLLQNGHRVATLNRGTRKANCDGATLIIADRHNQSEIESGLRGKSFDVVIDLSGYDKNDVSVVLNILGDKVAQYIFCSSIAVCCQPPVCWPITEDHKKCSSASESEYGYNKWLAEDCLFQSSLKSNLPVSIVRPVYVYGPYDYSGRLDYFFTRILEEQPVIMSGNGGNIIQLGYVYDLCRAIIALIGNQTAYGQAFNISGRELITTTQLVSLISAILGKSADVRFEAVGLVDPQGVSTITDRHRFSDISKAEKMLGIVPATSLSDGIKKTYEWWLTNRRSL
jgi:nucleoside-diphosphate-sugar epimerase